MRTCAYYSLSPLRIPDKTRPSSKIHIYIHYYRYHPENLTKQSFAYVKLCCVYLPIS
jgi:hypothetical protein